MIHLLIETINKPARVFFLCTFVAVLALTLDGTLYRYYSLKNEKKEIQIRISQIEKASEGLKGQIEMAKDPQFIERQARDRFDFVEEDDLVFIFSGD